MYLIDFSIIPNPGAECLHNERCYELPGPRREDGRGHRAAQESLKVNQCQRYYVEDSDISQLVETCRSISWRCSTGTSSAAASHDAGDWCMYFKGGSAYNNRRGQRAPTTPDNGGFSAGDGTGFDFHGRALDPLRRLRQSKFVNNIVPRQRAGAAVGVSGATTSCSPTTPSTAWQAAATR